MPVDGQRRPPVVNTLASGGHAPASGRVLFVVGEDHFGTYALPQGRAVVIGRDSTCDIPLRHPKISRRHTAIHTGDTLEVEDLGSTNGTVVAGTKLAQGGRAVLEAGSHMRVGPYVAIVLDASGDPTSASSLRAALPIADPTPAGVPEVVARVARGTVSVLIHGETGSGKEVLARTIHQLSGRPGQLVAINCASLSETLLESELFGYERGAFTGAATAKPGLFETAGGGTVFLDEIGELPANLQAKLLRVLESHSVYRVGGIRPVKLDVRFVSATHRSLLDEVGRGAFRQDLYFRVNGILMNVLPLRTRRDAIPRLAQAFLAEAMPARRAPPRIAAGTMSALMAHDWPGNVRELRTVMERAAVLCDGEEIRPSHLLLDARPPASAPSPAAATAVQPPPAAAPAAVRPEPPPGDGDDERQRILAALDACAGNQTRAARMLGMSRTTLVHKLAVHRIPRPRTKAR